AALTKQAVSSRLITGSRLRSSHLVRHSTYERMARLEDSIAVESTPGQVTTARGRKRQRIGAGQFARRRFAFRVGIARQVSGAGAEPPCPPGGRQESRTRGYGEKCAGQPGRLPPCRGQGL